jgi:hypothetical protein
VDKLEILKVLVELAEKESNRSWVRYSMMLYSSTGLLAVLSVTVSDGLSLISLLPSVSGIVIAIAWLRINILSYYYEHRWHADIEALIESDETFRQWIRGRNQPRIPRPLRSRSALAYFNTVPAAFLVLWASVIILVIVTESGGLVGTLGASQAWVVEFDLTRAPSRRNLDVLRIVRGGTDTALPRRPAPNHS